MLSVVVIPQHPFSLIGILNDLYLAKRGKKDVCVGGFLGMLQRPEKPKGKYDKSDYIKT